MIPTSSESAHSCPFSGRQYAPEYILILAALLLLLCSPIRALADNVDGAWTPVSAWPLISVHAALTPDGKVLSYGTTETGTQTGYFIYDIWDPSAGLGGGHLTLNNMTLTDIFCSSQVILPQTGDILIAGGDNWTGSGTTNTGNNNSNIFDYGDNTLARSANMNRARWYSSSTVLLDGEVYIQGGTGGADLPEVRETDGDFRLLTGAPTGSYATVFPRNFLAPDGRVFGYDTNGKMYYVNPAGAGSITPVGQFSSSSAGWTSGAAMFEPGRILQVGAGGSVVIDINGPVPVVTNTQPTSSQRRWVSATVLPDGQVLATGGSRVENQLTDVNNFAEIWNPDTGLWHRGAEGALARLYHSAGLLLPDASVLVSGGGAPGPLVNTNAEIYYPPYLFDSGGNPAARPAILLAPATANVGDTLEIQTDTEIGRITMVKSGSVTHSVNMDQRFVELPFSTSGGVNYAQLPARASDTPPGYYLLFAFDTNGVPSHGSMLRINIDPSPDTAVDYTPTIGGGGGAPFQLACPADEILVGVHGSYATYVNQVGPQCVKVDQLGRWIGNPVNGATTGNNSGTTQFAKTCPRDSAISGFEGRSGDYVNQIDIQCRALTSSGGLQGNPTNLGAVGGNGGSAQGALSCGTGNPVYALYGRSGGWIDSFGMLCRQAEITPISINTSPVIVNPGNQSGVVGTPVNITISASDGDGDPLSFSATGLPDGLQIASASGLVSGTPTLSGDYTVEITVTDGTETDIAIFTWTIAATAPLSVQPLPPQLPKLINTELQYTAVTSGGSNVLYSWNFGDGSAVEPATASPEVSHTFTSAGLFVVTLTVSDDSEQNIVETVTQPVHLELEPNPAAASSKLAYESRGGSNDRLWVANQDNDTVTVIDAVNDSFVAELAVESGPSSIAIAGDGRVWVANRDDDTIAIIDPAALSVVNTLNLPRGSAPYGLAFSPVSAHAYVVLSASGTVRRLDGVTGATLAETGVGGKLRHVSVTSDGSQVYVPRFRSPRQPGEETASVLTEVDGVKAGGEVVVLDATSLATVATVVLEHTVGTDSEAFGRGVPNYLGSAVMSPDGDAASVPSKLDNIARGALRDGLDLNFQNTVRAISSRIDTALLAEEFADRVDHDNASMASAVAFDQFGVYEFVALETSREIAVINAHGREQLFRINTGRAPQALALAPDGLKLFVYNFMDRSVGVYDISPLTQENQAAAPLLASIATVSQEQLAPDVLVGKQLFYDAADTRLARDNYLSCASCHNEGGSDGRVWDLTGFGEGLRNTIDLRGRAGGHGLLHWSQNFDEVQDFEGQIRTLSGGTGLMDNADFAVGTRSTPLGDPKAGISADLDALAAYVESLDEFAVSPFRNPDGSLTAAGAAGRQVFENHGCDSCHGGPNFSDSASGNLHDVGTMTPASGSRLDGPLTGIDTPTLRGAWATEPYLHDGSAQTLADAVEAHDGVSMTATELSQLVAYLQQIDALETNAEEGLVAYWPMHEAAGSTTADLSGNGHDGTLVNGAGWSPGPGISFDGVNDYVDVGNIDVSGSELTISAWIRSDQLDNCANYNDCRVLSKATSTSEQGHYFMLSTIRQGNATRLRFRLKTNGTTSTLIAGSGAVVENQWMHVAAVYDGSQMRLYLDGSQVGQAAKSGDLTTNPAVPVWIGSNPENPNQVPWDGQIDDVRLYSRALSAAEIAGQAAGNEAPNANPQSLTTDEDTAVSFVLTGSDPDGDPITFSVAGGPTQGSLSGAAPALTYSPDPDFNGSDFVDFQVLDNKGGISTARVSITVQAVNDAPVANGDSYSLVEGQTLTVPAPGILGNDNDVDGDALSAVITAGASAGSLAVNGDGSLTYTPNSGFTGTDQFTYRATDGQAQSGLATVSLTVNVYVPPNTPPTADDQAVVVDEDGSLPVVLTGSDIDGDPLTFSIVSAPASGTLVGSAPAVTYVPNADYFGADSFTFLANDGEDNSNTATVTVTVAPVNDPPVATAADIETGEDTPVAIVLSGSDIDGDALAYSITAPPANGQLTGTAPNLTYTPASGFSGSDSVGFSVSDGNGGTDTATVSITVTPTPSDLVGYWPMNEGSGTSTADLSGSGHTGSLVNGTLWSADGALDFDGVNDYVNVGNLDVPGSELTLAAWVRSDQLDNCQYYNDCRIVSKAMSTSSQDHYLMLSTINQSGQTRLRFRLKTGGNTTTLIASTGALAENRWTHVAAVYDGSFMRLYLDGVEVGAQSKSGTLTTNASVPVWIGSNPTNASQVPWDGQIDEVRIYDRALSAGEIFDLAESRP